MSSLNSKVILLAIPWFSNLLIQHENFAVANAGFSKGGEGQVRSQKFGKDDKNQMRKIKTKKIIIMRSSLKFSLFFFQIQVKTKISLYSDSARFSAQIYVRTKKRSSLRFSLCFFPDLGEDQNQKKRRSSLRFNPFFCPDFLPKFQEGGAWLNFVYYSEVFIHYWRPKRGGMAQCSP